jgi:hypothetical protein
MKYVLLAPLFSPNFGWFLEFPNLSSWTLKKVRKEQGYILTQKVVSSTAIKQAKDQAKDNILATLRSGQSAQWGIVYTQFDVKKLERTTSLVANQTTYITTQIDEITGQTTLLEALFLELI